MEGNLVGHSRPDLETYCSFHFFSQALGLERGNQDTAQLLSAVFIGEELLPAVVVDDIATEFEILNYSLAHITLRYDHTRISRWNTIGLDTRDDLVNLGYDPLIRVVVSRQAPAQMAPQPHQPFVAGRLNGDDLGIHTAFGSVTNRFLILSVFSTRFDERSIRVLDECSKGVKIGMALRLLSPSGTFVEAG
ncbi:hypothetical protein PC116_g24494 [Phytophthora cactorum]|uniref:Uncharacterized protein n=1 Tax=Phytophthora cactorum TaxID=29920 RepID=A0A329S1B0_9STRA|nr:hypothetical protein PC112_g20298 [Phytophthora cactorum]KAG2880137.1 hypothetical protein PC114_g22224 [Phytophthora cactorum]KAG2899295.1 hypothetical protein PC117_g22286 [Phytophthora cactorum]KAG4039828.1 hypothetical protein PC123_g24623 [Phytophthora cactorum]KAG4227105.1 hypothetical protein PC116_g24494 [Phytophthora cactorum]